MGVEFISYTGCYPCLCVGILKLKIDDRIYTFGDCAKHRVFWVSGGSIRMNDYPNVIKKPWEINEELLPFKLRKYSKEISDVINENIPFGCCGGCI